MRCHRSSRVQRSAQNHHQRGGEGREERGERFGRSRLDDEARPFLAHDGVLARQFEFTWNPDRLVAARSARTVCGRPPRDAPGRWTLSRSCRSCRLRSGPYDGRSRTLVDVEHRQHETRRMCRVVIERVGADFVGTIRVREQTVGDLRIAVCDFEPDAIAFAEAVGHRL
jgi:hypothetical protein